MKYSLNKMITMSQNATQDPVYKLQPNFEIYKCLKARRSKIFMKTTDGP